MAFEQIMFLHFKMVKKQEKNIYDVRKSHESQTSVSTNKVYWNIAELISYVLSPFPLLLLYGSSRTQKSWQTVSHT
jgi:hypothetical protein